MYIETYTLAHAPTHTYTYNHRYMQTNPGGDTHKHIHSCSRKIHKFLNEHTNIHKRDIYTSKHTKAVFVGALFPPMDCFCITELIFQPPRVGCGVDSPRCYIIVQAACTAAGGPNHPRPRGLRYRSFILCLFFYLDAPRD